MTLQKSLILGFVLSIKTLCFGQFEGNQTPTYPQLVHFYDSLAKQKKVELYNMGSSDYGLPIYLCVLNGLGDSLQTFQEARRRTSILINNGIHPGEPDGINACGKMTLAYVNGSLVIDQGVVFSFVLCYNVGGAMNRGPHSRANQVGPEAYGFRGNAQNLDLNRDFIKMDSKNAFTFSRIYHALDPDLFVDTHVSNGADYQHTLTLIYPLKERMEPALRKLTVQQLIPELKAAMAKKGQHVIPYVQSVKDVPDDGIEAFDDLPRYAMGYASLFHSLSITTETHMLKPFESRVAATHAYLLEALTWVQTKRFELEKARAEALQSAQVHKYFTYNFERTDQYDSLLFLGYQHGYKKSLVTGLDRLYYDRKQPFEKYIPYFNSYRALDSVRVPDYYLLKSPNEAIMTRLKENGVELMLQELKPNVFVHPLVIESYESGTKPYEGHYLHRKIVAKEAVGERYEMKKGDVLISTKQAKMNFICSVLEPEAPDSYFAWNFFDSFIQQKEYFSPYVFEEIAADLLSKDPELKRAFEEKRQNDSKFASSQWELLYFIYQRSPYFEASFMQLPVAKIYLDDPVIGQ